MSSALTSTIRLDAGISEEVVSFAADGVTLCGNLTLPDEPKQHGIVFVHGWSGYRNGPHGIITWLSRRFAAEGLPCFRFDFRGRGESEGKGLDATLVTMAEDLQHASAYFTTKTGIKSITYVGICSGGNVAIGSLPKLPKAASLILLSVYPFSDGDTFGRDVHRTWHYARIYLAKAFNGDTWRRLCRGDVHIGQVLNVLFGHLLRRGSNKAKEGNLDQEKTGPQVAKPTRAESRNQAEEAPTTHLGNLRPDCPAVMIYGTADPDASAARTYYGDYVKAHDLPITFVDIEGANHNFSSSAWKEEIALLALEFVYERG